jgi:hypothetical protein
LMIPVGHSVEGLLCEIEPDDNTSWDDEHIS